MSNVVMMDMRDDDNDNDDGNRSSMMFLKVMMEPM